MSALPSSAAEMATPGPAPRPLLFRALVVSMLLLAGLALTAWMRPEVVAESFTPGTLARGIPERVEGWEQIPQRFVMADLTVAANDGVRTNDNPYDEVVSRQYADRSGQIVMLAVAYAAEQRQEVKIHRPDLCYPSQGFKQLSWEQRPLPAIEGERGPVGVVRMVVQQNDRIEVVLYWLRTGSDYGQRMWDGRVEILQQGLKGRVPDGILVRTSMIVPRVVDAPQAFAELERFAVGLYKSSDAGARALMVR